MDHKVSKDMISSGMIPSGEKTQADLGKTQYGSAPSPSKLMDAYKSMYDKKEEVINEHHKKDADGNTIPHEHEEELNEGKIPAGLQAYLDKKKGKKEDKKEMKEGAGLYANIHAKRKRGGKMRKKGAKGAPSSQDFANASKTAKEEVENIGEALPLVPLIAKGAAMLGKVGAAAGKVGAAAAKTGVKVAAKSKIPGATNVVKSVARDPMGAVDKVGRASFAAQQVGSMIPKPKIGGMTGVQKGTSSTTVSADLDLFDIVKGQLLDEGLSEEEIRDIMLTLTPDEIMEELSDIVKRNDAINKANAMKAAEKKQVPQEVRDASKRQYTAGGPKDTGSNKYTTQDKKTIINYNKDKGSM